LTNINHFSNFFIGTLSGHLAIKWLLSIHHSVTALVHYRVKYKCKKKINTAKQQACGNVKDTSDQNRSE